MYRVRMHLCLGGDDQKKEGDGSVNKEILYFQVNVVYLLFLSILIYL